MLRIISTCAFMLIAVWVMAQEQPNNVPDEYMNTQRSKADEKQIFERVELDPSFYVDGKNLNNWLVTKVEEVRSSQKKLPHGKAIVKAVIERDGSVGSYQFQNKVNRKLKLATESIIKSMPKWNPANQNGDKVRCYTTFEVTW